LYIALYDENKNHIVNVTDVTYDLTERVYDPDGFSAVGNAAADINAAKFLVLNDEAGNYVYSCFVDNVKPEYNTRQIKGLDFKTLFDLEVLIDYTQPGAFDARLSAIFNKVASLVLNDPDAVIQKIPVELIIPEDNADTTDMFGSLQGEYLIKNAYDFLKGYLKLYEYNVEARYSEPHGKIIIAFVKCAAAVDITLSDFIYELQTTSSATNKTVAVVQYKPEVKTDDETGEKYAEDENGNRIPVPPRPGTLATAYYYRDNDNNIVRGDAAGNIPNRIYPVRCKIFESEYLADAQFDAVYELANSRYIDNIILDHNKIIDPIDLSGLALYTKINIYHEGKFYKTLPVSEKITTVDANGVNIKIKLGFKKILLTEIIKGGN
jgi:hypothetical protein